MLTPEEQRDQLLEFAGAKRKRFLEFVLESPDAAIADLHERCKPVYVEDRGITEAVQLVGMHQAIFSPFLVWLESKGITRETVKTEFVNAYLIEEEPP